MLRKTLGGMLVIVWVLAPVVSAPQELAPGRWWRLPQVAKQLNLSPEEKRVLDDLFVNSRRRLIDLKSALELQRFDLENLLEQERLNDKAVMEQFRKLEKARSDLADERFHALLEARKILGFERYQQLKTLFREFKKKRHAGGKHGRDQGDSLLP